MSGLFRISHSFCTHLCRFLRTLSRHP
jgi:hypothetical protein